MKAAILCENLTKYFGDVIYDKSRIFLFLRLPFASNHANATDMCHLGCASVWGKYM